MKSMNDKKSNPGEIKREVLRQLSRARTAMMELDFLLELEKRPVNERREAALQLTETQLAYLKMRQAELRNIRKDLLENEIEIKQRLTALDKAMVDLQKIEAITGAVAGLLRSLQRVLNRTR